MGGDVIFLQRLQQPHAIDRAGRAAYSNDQWQ
jgi:hypothetical protein